VCYGAAAKSTAPPSPARSPRELERVGEAVHGTLQPPRVQARQTLGGRLGALLARVLDRLRRGATGGGMLEASAYEQRRTRIPPPPPTTTTHWFTCLSFGAASASDRLNASDVSLITSSITGPVTSRLQPDGPLGRRGGGGGNAIRHNRCSAPPPSSTCPPPAAHPCNPRAGGRGAAR
jgi:hypothetical protein